MKFINVRLFLRSDILENHFAFAGIIQICNWVLCPPFQKIVHFTA